MSRSIAATKGGYNFNAFASFQIDATFKAQIPPPLAEERDQLEANIVANGCRDPLTVWNGVLLDGRKD